MKKYFVYAEDDPDDFAILKHALEEINPEIELMQVGSGFELIQFLQNKTEASFPSLILLDMKLPMLDGRETVSLLKIDDRFKTIPVVFLSGSHLPANIDVSSLYQSEVFRKPSLYEEWKSIARQLSKYCPALLLAMVCK